MALQDIMFHFSNDLRNKILFTFSFCSLEKTQKTTKLHKIAHKLNSVKPPLKQRKLSFDVLAYIKRRVISMLMAKLACYIFLAHLRSWALPEWYQNKTPYALAHFNGVRWYPAGSPNFKAAYKRTPLDNIR